MPMVSSRHQWSFFRAGGVNQVVIADGSDLANLEALDQKLWAALACPTRGLELDTRTLDSIDADKDGRIRPPEILAAVRWAKDVFASLDDLFAGGDRVPLASINQTTPTGKGVLAGARRILQNLGKGEADSISLEDVADTARIFPATRFNGDGVVPAHAAEDEPTQRAIADIIATQGATPDRSGQPGVNAAAADKFFAEADATASWLAQGEGGDSPKVLGEATGAAADALLAVRAKVDDYFTRCRLASFDGKAAAALNPSEADWAALHPKDLTGAAPEIARLPLARIDAGRPLPLVDGLNPAWASRIATLASAAVRPILGGTKLALTEVDWAACQDKLAPFVAWMAARPVTPVAALGNERVRELAAGPARQQIAELLAKDIALAAENDQIQAIEKMLLLRRDLVTLLRNFVSFAAFYAERKAAFQAGTLFLDGRSCDLCLPVVDTAKHAAVAGMAHAYLVYCDCTRPTGEKRGIVAAVTGGDTDNLMAGRNGVFYDRQGRDWDATVTRVVENPISVRQAIFSPYKRLVRLIEEQVAKRAAAADEAAQKRTAAAATEAAHADQTQPAQAATKPEARKIDVGTVAAIGVAVAGVATFASGILATAFGLGRWMPLGLLALLLAISGPSMLVAWLKLRQRNLGPILDANAWAVNTRARLNVPFGAALTQVAALPKGSRRDLHDPFAAKKTPWGLILLLAFVLAGAVLWYLGHLDNHVPPHLRASTLLGRAPAAQTLPADRK